MSLQLEPTDWLTERLGGRTTERVDASVLKWWLGRVSPDFAFNAAYSTPPIVGVEIAIKVLLPRLAAYHIISYHIEPHVGMHFMKTKNAV